MHHRHGSFCTATAKKVWTAPALTATRLSPTEIDALYASPAALGDLAFQLKRDRRV